MQTLDEEEYMTLSIVDCPQIAHYFVPGEGIEFDFSTITRTATEKLLAQLAEAREAPRSNIPSSLDVHPVFRPEIGNITAPVPVVNAGEMYPNELVVIQNAEDLSTIDEIHFSYGIEGMRAATFALRYTEDNDQLPRMIYAPGEEGEREVFPDSHEFHIRMGQAADLARECSAKEYSHDWAYLGVEHGTIQRTQESSTIDQLAHRNSHSKLLIQTRGLLEKKFDIPFGR